MTETISQTFVLTKEQLALIKKEAAQNGYSSDSAALRRILDQYLKTQVTIPTPTPTEEIPPAAPLRAWYGKNEPTPTPTTE